MIDWSAPQWTMALYLCLSILLPPVFFAMGKERGVQMGVTWRQFFRARFADSLEKAFFAGVLIWGGFF